MGNRQPRRPLGDELDHRKLLRLERVLLDVPVAHLLVALQRAQIDGQLRSGGVDGSVRVDNERPCHGLGRADGVTGERDAGKLFPDLVSRFGSFGDLEFLRLRRIRRRGVGAAARTRSGWRRLTCRCLVSSLRSRLLQSEHKGKTRNDSNNANRFFHVIFSLLGNSTLTTSTNRAGIALTSSPPGHEIVELSVRCGALRKAERAEVMNLPRGPRECPERRAAERGAQADTPHSQ